MYNHIEKLLPLILKRLADMCDEVSYVKSSLFPNLFYLNTPGCHSDLKIHW